MNRKNLMKRLNDMVFNPMGAVAIVLFCCLCAGASCSGQQTKIPKPEIRDYDDIYVPKSKFDSVRQSHLPAAKLFADSTETIKNTGDEQ